MPAVWRLVPPPVAVGVAALAMWGIRRNFELGSFSFRHQVAIAVALIALGIAVLAASVARFVAMRTTPNPLRPADAATLVTSGPYSLSRNPMYVGDVIVLAGIALWLGSTFAVIPIALFIWYIDRYQIAAEEQALARRFGEEYDAYRASVRRWI